MFEDLWDLGKPSVAKVRGYCLAGGLGLALACDLVVAADDATFGTPEIDIGIWPFMVTVALLQTVTPKRALELMMTGRRIDASEAERIGIATRVVPVDELDGAVDDLAWVLARKPPGAMRAGRDSFYTAMQMESRAALGTCTPCSPSRRSAMRPPRAAPPSPSAARRRGPPSEPPSSCVRRRRQLATTSANG